MNVTNTACQICGEKFLREVDDFAALPRITSDCRAHPVGGSLYVCLACGGVQKLPDTRWLSEIAGIYAGYEAYYQSGGEEQVVFDRATGTPRRRSDVLLSRLLSSDTLPARGCAVDIGCGNGATLASMSASLTGWTLSGFELGDGALPRLSRIPGFERLYTGSLESITDRFDLVTMVHSLEHFPSPASALKQLRPIVGDGRLFIEVCNVEENPFDILVADHLIHFSPMSLSRLLQRVGFQPILLATDWVAKEISLLAQATHQQSTTELVSGNPDLIYLKVKGYVKWLSQLREIALEAAESDRPFGLFGTSIAATWLAPQLRDKVAFFVDEDNNRIGKEHLGRPIISPSAIPNDARVLLALAPGVASAIAARLRFKMNCELVLPPLIEK